VEGPKKAALAVVVNLRKVEHRERLQQLGEVQDYGRVKEDGRDAQLDQLRASSFVVRFLLELPLCALVSKLRWLRFDHTKLRR